MATVGAPLFRVALEEAIHNITALNQPAETVLPVIEARYVLLRTYLNWKLQYMMFQFLESYRRTLGMTPVAPDRPSFPPNPAPPPSASGGGVETSTLVVAIVVPVVVTLLAVLLAVLLVVRSRHLSTSHNKVFAPGMGPDTTLLCTDIQNSTLLWESLDPAVMDMAVSVHHECLQSCMNTHSGYLSAMEGDSFIIAFHNAQSAILFAVDAQLALLQSEWPIELLAAPDCRPEWASPRPDDYLPYSHSCAAAASGGDRSNTRFSPVRRSISNMQTVAALVPVPADDESAGFMRKMSSVIRRSFAGLSDAEPGVPKVPKGESPVLSWSRALGLRRALRGSAREDFFGGERMNSSPVDLPDADIVEFEDPSRRVPAVDPPPPLPLPMPFKSGLLQNLSVRLALGHPKPPPKPLPPPPHRPQVEFGVVQSADSTSSSAAATPMSQHRLLQPSRASQQLTFKPSHPPRVLQPLHSGIAIENMQPGISIGGLLQQHQQQLQQQQQASPARPPPLDKSGSFERLMASANFTFNKLAHVALSVTQPSLSSHRSSVDTTPAVGGGAANATAAAGGGTPCSGVNHLVSPAGGLDTSQRAVLRTLRHSKTGEFDSPIAEPLANGAVKRISGSDRGSEWRNANSPYGGDMGQASPAILSQTGGTADGIVPLSTLGSDARHGMADSFAPPFRLGSGGRRGSNASSISGCMGGFSAFASPGLQAELGLHGVDIVVERSGGSDEDADEGVMPSPFERFQPDLGLGFTLDDNATTSTTSNHHNNHHSDHGGANGDTGGGEDGSKERVTTASRCLSPMRLVSMTWLQLMRYSVEVETDLTEADMGDRKDRVLVHNGIRVRMGLYSGIASMDDIVFNQAAGNVQFSGEPLEAVKAVCSAAGGGMVLLARETYGRLVPQRLDRRVLLLYAGDHHLEESRRHWVLYQAAPVALPQRMAVTDPVKSLTVLQLGTPSAPVGLVTIVFMYVIGASTLLTELPEEARRALALFHTVVTRELLTWRGYLVEAVDGLILAAFSNTASATCWSLACQNLMLEQPWSTELLAHECCEEVFVVHDTVSLATSAGSGVGAEHSGRMSLAQVVSISLDEAAAAAGAAAAGAGSGRGAATASALAQMMSVKLDDLAVGGVRGGALGTAAGDQLVLAVVPAAKKRRVLMRGLRLKIGLDVGRPVPDINTNSGRMQYRGRVMNRAARIASKASAGHVVCSGAAWQDIQENPSNMPAARKRGPLSAESMGMYDLKGIMEPLELFDCRHDEVDSNLQGAGFSGILWRVDEQ